MRDVGKATIVNTQRSVCQKMRAGFRLSEITAQKALCAFRDRPVGRKSAAGKQKAVFDVFVQNNPIVFERHAEK